MSLSKVPFSFWAAFPVAGLGLGLASWLVFGLRFDLKTSPGWQLAPYFLALSCPLVMSMILGAQRCFSWMGRARFLLLVLPLVILGVFLGLDWLFQSGEPYMGLRDDRLFPVVMRSASSSVVAVAVLALFQALVMFTRIIAHRRDLSRIVPPGWSADPDDFGKGRVGH